MMVLFIQLFREAHLIVSHKIKKETRANNQEYRYRDTMSSMSSRPTYIQGVSASIFFLALYQVTLYQKP